MYLLTGFMGIVALASPFLLGYSTNSVAMWTTLAIGSALIVTSVMEAVAEDKDRWEYWVVGIIGVGAILAPFTLGFGTLMNAVWTLVAVGLITLIASATKLYPWRNHYG